MANIYQREMFTESAMGNVKDALSQVGSIGSQVKQQGKQEEDKAQELLLQARKRYSTQLNNASQTDMQLAYENYGSNPTELEKELNNIRDNYANNIEDNEVKSDFLADFELKSRTILGKSNVAFAQAQRKENKALLEVELEHSYQLSKDTLINAFGGFNSPDDVVNYMRGMEQRRAGESSDLLSASEKKSLQYKTNRLFQDALNDYSKGLSAEEKYKLHQNIANGKFTLGGVPLNKLMDKESYDTLKSSSKTYTETVEEAVKNGETQNKAVEISDAYDLSKERLSKLKAEKTVKNKDTGKETFNATIDETLNYIDTLNEDYIRGTVDKKTFREYNELFAENLMNKMDKENRDNMFVKMTSSNRQDAFNMLDEKLEKYKKDTGVSLDNKVVKAGLYTQVYKGLKSANIDPDESNWLYIGSEKKKKLANIVNDVYNNLIIGKDTDAILTEASRILVGRTVAQKKDEMRPVQSDEYQVYEEEGTGKKYKKFKTGEKVYIK